MTENLNKMKPRVKIGLQLYEGMTEEEALSILKRYQEWRLGADTEMIEPKEITKAIDIVINVIDTKLNNNETDSI